MTIAELSNAMNSAKRVQESKMKEKAYYDYILADLIGFSISRLYSSSAKYPKIYEVYPNLFNKEIIEQEEQRKKTELSAEYLKQFVDSFNKRFQEGDKN